MTFIKQITVLWVAVYFVILCSCVPVVRAQSGTSGALSGVVKDSSGGAVAGATITITNFANGQAQTTMTGTIGSYGFATLAPGTYSLHFSTQGFKTAQMPSVVVNVSEAVVIDAILEAGETTQTVMCQCALRQGGSSSSGTLVDSKTITSVPLTTRNFTQVLSMSSGSAADVNNAGSLGRGNQNVNVNGNTANGSYTINGAWATSTVPNPDTLTEFKIQTSAYDSGYGAMTPQTNVLTKSGGNEFHGALWEFLRNDIFNANSYFRNKAGQPKPNLKQNQFGATAGGAIKRDKLFFFGSFQGTRQVNALDSSSGANLVLPPLTNDRSAAGIAAAICPFSATRRNTFAGGMQLDCLPGTAGSNINPVALNILQAKLADGTYWIPTPQSILTSGTNAGLGFSSYSLPSTYNENQYMINTDYVISKKHTLSSKLFFSRLFQFRTFGAPIAAGLVQFTPGGPQGLNAHDYVTSLKLTSIVTNQIVNEARVDFTRNSSFAWGPGIPTATSLQMRPVDPLFDEPPEITIQGALGVYRVFGNAANDFLTQATTYQYSDNISWVHGKHTTRTGVFFAKQQNNRLDTGSARGKATFQNFTDFLIGRDAANNGTGTTSNVFSISANEGVGPNGEVQYQYQNYYGAAFVEDDFKLTPRFTLNLGLRWEYIGPSFDTLGTVGTADPSLAKLVPIPPASGTFVGETVAANYNPAMINPYTGLPFGPPPAGVFVRSTKSFYRNDAPLNNFAPRFGFAWQPGSQQRRLSVRGGYGWFYATPTFSGNAANTPLFTAQPFAQGFGNTGASNSGSSIDKPFPIVTLGFVPRTLTSRLSDRVAGPRLSIPRTQQWNFNLQYSISSTLSLDVGYVGSYGNHLLLQRGLNQPILADASNGNKVNCGYDGIPADCITTNTAANAAQRVPVLGELPTALAANEYTGHSWYHGLQATLRKQISHGLTFQAAYTFSKSENNTVLFNDQNNQALDWARATFDRTQRLITNFNYELPVLNRSNGWMGKMSSGWSVSGIFIMQTGTPMTLTDPSGGGVYGNAGASTITLCPNATNSSLVTHGRDQERLNGWFNTTGVICSAPLLGPGAKDTGYGNAGQGLITGPGQFNTDFSLGKVTTVGGLREDAQLGFRVEFYNAFNHPQFANPGTTVGSSTFGVITLTSVAPRLIQFGLKYVF